MSDIAPISRATAASPPVNGRTHAVGTSTSAPTRGEDSVEFSPRAQFLSKLNDLPDVRQDLVDRVRGQIASGTYETDDKVDKAIENFLKDL